MIVGFAGYAGSGKDTAAQALIDLGWRRIAFADKLKEMAVRINPCVATDGGHLRLAGIAIDEGWHRIKQQPDVRAFLQNLGVAAREILGEDVWVDAALPSYRLLGSVVVTDIRFPNELDRIRGLDGIVVWVSRPGVGPVNGHISEHAVTEQMCDISVVNDGTIDDLREWVREEIPWRVK